MFYCGTCLIFFCQISNVPTRDFSKFTNVDRPVSKYVFEVLDLEIGEQTRFIACPRVGGLSGVSSQDKVMSVARACKELIPHNFVKKLKFCCDEADRTVYCLTTDDQVSKTYCAYYVRVGEVNVTFCKVSSIVTRENLVRAYLDADITVKECFLILFFFLVFLCFNVKYSCMLLVIFCFISFLYFHSSFLYGLV